MRTLKVYLAAALLLVPVAASADQAGKPNASFTPEETKAIGAIVREYILANPQILVESLQLLEERERVAQIEAQRAAVAANVEDLTQDPSSPVLGNPDGDITVVEFFDYRCPYCRKVSPDLMEAVDKDGEIRLVMKEFPILGPDSVVASRAALAAVKQDRYREFHMALMTAAGELNEDNILLVAETSGLDVERLRADMQSEDVRQQIRKTYLLAKGLQIGGTPAFVIGEEIVPGAVPIEQLLEIVARERAKTG